MQKGASKLFLRYFVTGFSQISQNVLKNVNRRKSAIFWKMRKNTEQAQKWGKMNFGKNSVACVADALHTPTFSLECMLHHRMLWIVSHPVPFKTSLLYWEEIWCFCSAISALSVAIIVKVRNHMIIIYHAAKSLEHCYIKVLLLGSPCAAQLLKLDRPTNQ